eukprot:6814513-Alexandrium_andersonii.AAC.1
MDPRVRVHGLGLRLLDVPTLVRVGCSLHVVSVVLRRAELGKAVHVLLAEHVLQPGEDVDRATLGVQGQGLASLVVVARAPRHQPAVR